MCIERHPRGLHAGLGPINPCKRVYVHIPWQSLERRDMVFAEATKVSTQEEGNSRIFRSTVTHSA